MSVRADGTTILLEGICGAEDAEALLRHLLSAPAAVVDWRNCDEAHTAVVQVLMAAKAQLRGPPRGAFLQAMVEPALNAGTNSP